MVYMLIWVPMSKKELIMRLLKIDWQTSVNRMFQNSWLSEQLPKATELVKDSQTDPFWWLTVTVSLVNQFVFAC